MMRAALLALFALVGFAQPKSFAKADIKLLGSLDYGQTSPSAQLVVKPAYCAYDFNARPGDHIEITVRGQGTLRAFLTNAQYEQVAGGSAQFNYTFDPKAEPGTYYILVMETHHRTARFTVELERPSNTADASGPQLPAPVATPQYLSCSSNADCVAVQKAGCCHNGYKEAVNASLVSEYRAANACQEPHHMCPMFLVVDKRVARCNTALRRCEMIQPETARP